MWYARNRALRYHPMFPTVSDNDVLNIKKLKCKYAGYEIYDSLVRIGEEVRGDVSAPDRWKAVRTEIIGHGPEFEAQTKSLLIEMIDRHWTGDRRRRYTAGCGLRHGQEAVS